MTPIGWRDLLARELTGNRLRAVQRLESYYDGDHPVPTPPKGMNPAAFEHALKAYRALAAMSITNWVKLVADAPAERLEVVGFRSSEDNEISEDAWRTWQTFDLDAQSMWVHDNALQTGQSFVLVDPWSGDITCEHSSQMIVAYRPGSRTEVEAALKLWDDDGTTMSTLYLPDGVHKWEQKTQTGDPTDRDGGYFPHDLGVVPVVEFAANPSLKPRRFGGGTGEFATVLPIQDRINKSVFDRLATGEAQAFIQRFIIGWTPELDDDTGLPKETAMKQLRESMTWTFEGDPSDIKIGELGQADFVGFIESVESDVTAMAAISKTPPHYLLGKVVNISGDGMAIGETGLISKTKKHARNFGASWERVMRLNGKVTGTALGDDVASEIVWGDIEHRTWGEQVDAVVKMKTLDVPRQGLWERLPEVSPQTIQRWEAMVETEALLTIPDEPVENVEPVATA